MNSDESCPLRQNVAMAFKSPAMTPKMVLGGCILLGMLDAYCDAIASEGEILMGVFTLAGFVMILLMDYRQEVRFPILMRTVFADSHSKAGEGVVQNVSMGGCKVKSTTTLPPGAELRLLLYPPSEAPQIEIQKAIVRSSGDGQFGVQFSKMEHEHKERLRHLIAKFL